MRWARRAVTPDPGAQLGADGARTYHAVIEANDLRVVVAPRTCTDVRSGQTPIPEHRHRHAQWANVRRVRGADGMKSLPGGACAGVRQFDVPSH